MAVKHYLVKLELRIETKRGKELNEGALEERLERMSPSLLSQLRRTGDPYNIKDADWYSVEAYELAQQRKA